MAIGLQKLSAGSGYAYLTRQVAAMDATGRGHTTLADYYSDRGESPGRWFGDGLAGVGLTDGEVVTEEQMKLLFGAGLNPTTGERLGRRYAVYANEPTPFEAELAPSVVGSATASDGAPVPREVRTRARTDLAQEWFVRDYGRLPSGPRELHGFIAKSTSHPRTSVAGFDATFTPPKSVSVLWAVAPPELAATIRAAHEAAVADAIAAIERRVAFTRQGHDGARHIQVRGVLAAVFVHRDSRAGDPNLHTHVAIANKVQTTAGDWLALDAQVLYRAKVTLSEEYTTSLQARLTDLGLAFVANRRDGKRPVYEVAGVDPRLVARWSFRRLQVTVRTGELVAQFQADHERPPTPAERLELAQQATLDTRQAKHHPRSEGEQRAGWRAEAERILGPGGTARMLGCGRLSSPSVGARRLTAAMLERMAARVIGVVQAERSSWTAWHVRSEALRHVRASGVALEHLDEAVEAVVQHALSPQLSIPIRTTRSEPVEPDLLRRSDGQSVYAQPAGGALHIAAGSWTRNVDWWTPPAAAAAVPRTRIRSLSRCCSRWRTTNR